MPDFLTTADGRWAPISIKKLKPLVADAEWYNVPGRSWVLHHGDVVLATLRRRRFGANRSWWSVRIYGHEYRVTPDMAAARIWPVGSYISLKPFQTTASAKREVARVLKVMTELSCE
jgi:hypothetical protein